MKRQTATVEVVSVTSEVRPEITSDIVDADIIEWADATPMVWDIVTGTRSAPFGRCSSHYIGWAQKIMTPAAILCRLRTLRDDLESGPPFWMWRARFTLEHYGDKGFRGGFFRQYDANCSRHCCDLDYTPQTLELAIDKFVEWCGATYQTRRITVDNKVVRAFEEEVDPLS